MCSAPDPGVAQVDRRPRSAGLDEYAVKLENLIIPAGQGIAPAGQKDFELAICEWPSRDGEKPAPAGDGDGEIGMGVSGRGGDRLQRRHIGSVQDDPESVQPPEVERIGDDRADDGGGDRYRRTELAVALAGPPEKRDGTGRAPARARSGLDAHGFQDEGDRAGVRTCATGAGVSWLQLATVSMRPTASTLARTDNRRGGG